MDIRKMATQSLDISLQPTPAHAQQKPNFVLVFMDNLGWGKPGFNSAALCTAFVDWEVVMVGPKVTSPPSKDSTSGTASKCRKSCP